MQDMSTITHAHTTAWGFLQKKKEKKKLILTDICPHSLAVSHCIKKKKSYIKAALKQTSGAMTLKGGRQSFE